jgi:uncharacterized protein
MTNIGTALIDTNFIVALLDTNDPEHANCVQATRTSVASTVVTTWPVITETMYFLHKKIGLAGQEGLYNTLANGSITVAPTPNINLIWQYMAKYADLPLDFADASLAALAVASGIKHIFTMDVDFRVVTVPLGGNSVMDVLR